MIERDFNPDYLNDFLDYIATILNKSENTIKEYNYDIAHFLKHIKVQFGMAKVESDEEIKSLEIKDIPLSTVAKIELANIHAFLSYLKRNYRSKPATISRKNAAIRTFFNYLCNKTKRIPKNPAQDLENPKPEKRLPKYLSLEESKRLLEISQSEEDRNAVRNYAIITLFLNCGMRLSELCGINIKDIDFTENKLNVIGKGNKERTIYLNNACIKAINAYLAERPKVDVKYASRDALFLSEQKKRISNRTVQHIVKQELKKTGLDINKYSVHKLRPVSYTHLTLPTMAVV